MASVRRKARIQALEVLYEVDCTTHGLGATLDRALEESILPEEGRRMARDLVEGVSGRRDELDEVIRRHAPAWPVEQLSAVDRNILRIAIFEILMNNKTPPKAAVNEAVELAKVYGGETTPRFINGVLGSVLAGAGAQ